MIYVLLALIALLQALDIATTAKALKMGFDEANPLARLLFGWLPMLPAAIAAKLLFTAPIALVCWAMPDVLVRQIGPVDIRIWHVGALYAASLVWIVRHNASIIRRAGG